MKESFYREQKNYEKKVKMSQIKMHQVLPQGELLQREERLLCRWFRFAQLAKGKKFRP
jgi:hypothetical protein